MAQRYDVVIVGGGHGGAQTAIALRRHKLAGSVAIVGEEPALPYERPPLSKDYLARKKGREALLLRSAAFWADRSVHMQSGRRVIGVEPDAKAIVTSEGERLEYGSLVWATGGQARRLSCRGHDLRGVHYVRTAADIDRLHGELNPGARIAIIGGGYIGLEVAATLSSLGHAVTLVEALDRVLARAAGETILIASTHRGTSCTVGCSSSGKRVFRKRCSRIARNRSSKSPNAAPGPLRLNEIRRDIELEKPPPGRKTTRFALTLVATATGAVAART
jgi:NAD(P)H-nitrite reductase large subunit